MSRIALPSLEDAPEASKPTLEAVKAQLGVVPNLYRLVALSPAALKGFAANSGALNEALDARTRERIAVAVAEIDDCSYCRTAHAYIGHKLARLSLEELELNRKGGSGDAKAAAAVRFAAQVARERGHVGDDELRAVRNAGYQDSQIVEIVALVALNVFTNFVNEVAKTAIDFPDVRAAA